jgi:Cys-rich repeat protein
VSVRVAPWLLLLAACDWPTMSLAERIVDASADGGSFDAGADAADARGDADADIDEDIIFCSSAAECPDPREPEETLCNLSIGQCVECLSTANCPSSEMCAPNGECVECFSDADCPQGETCDQDGDCDD